jgi:putative transposase
VDFVHDQFARFRILNIVDDVTWECLAAIPDSSIPGRRVARELTALIGRRGKPARIDSRTTKKPAVRAAGFKSRLQKFSR